MADHLERGGARPDDYPGLQDDGFDPGIQQNLTDGGPRLQVPESCAPGGCRPLR